MPTIIIQNKYQNKTPKTVCGLTLKFSLNFDFMLSSIMFLTSQIFIEDTRTIEIRQTNAHTTYTTFQAKEKNPVKFGNLGKQQQKHFMLHSNTKATTDKIP